MKLYLTALGIISRLGDTKEETFRSAINSKSASEIKTKFPEIKEDLYNIRCNKLLQHCYEQIKTEVSDLKAKYGSERIGIIIGTSNSGIEEIHRAVDEKLTHGEFPKDFDYRIIEMGNPANYLQKISGLDGVCYAISTACSSSAKAFSSARRLIENDICDAVLVGGTDSLCRFTDAGFGALEAVSQTQTNPFSKNRNGINIGEGAGLFILDKTAGKDGISLAGIGESSDAYHITSPHPEGIGAASAMQKALDDAGLKTSDIDYVNLHGTGTLHNDAMEARAMDAIFPNVPCSSTKPLTGHCLGASGIVELALCWLTLSNYNKNQELIPHVYDGDYDENIPKLNLVGDPIEGENIKYCASSSFAFGGSNVCVMIGKN